MTIKAFLYQFRQVHNLSCNQIYGNTICSRKSKNPLRQLPTCACAVEDCFSLPIKLLSKDRAVVHVAGVDQAACGIFEEQITLPILLRLKQLKL